MGGEEGNIDDYTQDGTVDLKGNPVRRSQRGGWRACSFVVVYEVFERMAYYGISSNLVLYLTNKLHQGTVKSANNVTNWVGTIWVTPIVGAYVADAHLGRYWTFAIASCIYLMPNISTIGADQFDEFEPKEKAHKLSFFNWWMFSIFFGTLFANTVLVYIQDNVGWTLGYGLPTLGLAISIAIFFAGTPFYRHKKPTGSPFTRMAKVIVAAIRKWNVPLPTDPKELYELNLEDYAQKGKYRIDSTQNLRFFNKAAVKTSSTNPWMLCSVTQVEETKQMLAMIPILVATFVPSTMLAQINTLFVKQGTTLDRAMGSNFKIPPASLTGFVTLSMLICVVLYDRYFVRITRRWTKNPRGITLLQRMGIGLVIHIIIMVIASFTERYRLSVAKDHGIVEKGQQVPLTIFVLLPQFVLMGTADAFLEVAKIEFFYDQAPESMKSLGTSYSMTTLGIGNFLSTFLLSTVSDITKRHGHKGWILNNLNVSHLDYYYAFFAILNVLNFVFFLVVAKFYVYKAEVSDSMEVLTEELKVMRLRASAQEATVAG
ncbi:protein NRT1/ PTR FAMILY 5.2 [Citrus sinensis]|uniref:Protein NRT1/ PTR FAMILY 5.2 n=1 Tax=Citrus sinensis TaxID=2711 RepID=A0ACB8I497_CITSI|nr:protein NRT1/ PTR FAMILY 5.2 [Citrus sinensis]